MQLENYLTKILDDFPGLWARGQNDQVPLDHFSDCLNVDYEQGEVHTRVGLTVSISVGYGSGNGKILRYANFINSVAIITLLLDDAGNLYTFSVRSGDTATTPLINVSGATDFVAIQLFNRIYIAFSDGVTGKNGVNLKVYIPATLKVDDVIRDAAGVAPAPGSPMLAALGAAGLVNAGIYKIAVAYETTSGFITPPGPKITSVFTPTIYSSPPGLLAVGLLTATANFGDGETVTIGGITYTFKTVLGSGVPNQILISTTKELSLANLANAINTGTGVPGVDYSVITTNPGVDVTVQVATLVVVAQTGGTSGNSIKTTETCANAGWGNTTLTGGTDGNKISLTVIPTGPAGTTKRHILITKANETEYFFLPSDFGGVIADNTTTIATLDFDDTTDLVESAEYLFTLLETIPAPLGLASYSARLVTFGEYGNTSILKVSNPGDPETIDATDGIIIVSKDDGFYISNSTELRTSFYIHKSLGVYAAQDNGDVPANWPVYPIDKTINTPIHGISEFFNLSAIKASRDKYYCVDRSGILMFNGTFHKPPLTYKINALWQRINFTYYYKIVLVFDEQKHKFYCAFPIDTAVENDTLIVGDYSQCNSEITDVMNIKFSIYQFNPGGTLKKPTCMGLGLVLTDSAAVPTLHFGSVSGGGKLWFLDDTATLDVATAIESYVETALIYWEDGKMHHFAGVQLRITGSGNFEISIRGEDNILPLNLYSIHATNPPIFLGTGLSDLTLSGTYSGSVNKYYLVKITTAAGTDKFKWSNDNGQTYSAEITITGAAQLLEGGLSITFAATTGHTLNDNWQITALNNPLTLSTAPGREILARFNFKNEKAKIKVRLQAGKFILSTATLYGEIIYSMRPA